MTRLPKRIRKLPVFGRMTLTKGQEMELDKLWALAVKTRAGMKCEVSPCWNCNLQSHHVKGRRNKTLRHVVSNGVSLCAKHHLWAEQNGVDFAEWIISKRGRAWWNGLNDLARQIKTWKEFTIVKKYLQEHIYG